MLTTNDLRGADVDSPATDLVFTVTGETNGWIALASAPGTHITTFTEGQLEAGSVVFIEDNANPTPPALPPTSASFSVSLTDGVAGTTPATATVNATVTDAEHDLWGEVQYPAVVQGEHLFGVNPQFNSQAGVIVLAYSDTFNYSPGGTNTQTRNLETLDPFFLPDSQAPQTLTDSPDTVVSPGRYSFILPNISFSGNVAPEGIYTYKGQVNPDGSGGNAIWQVFVTADSNGDGGINTTTPVQLGIGLTSATIFNLTESFKNNSSATATSYDVAWDQFDSSNNYKLEIAFVPINSDGTSGTPTIISPEITEGGATSVSVVDDASLPAWHFRSASGTTGISYALTVAEVDTSSIPSLNVSGSHYAIHLQGYTATGTLNANGPNVIIQPDLSYYAPGATNTIFQPIIPSLSPYPGQVAQALQFVQVSSNNASDYAIAWNETVTVNSSSHDQVEFVVFKPNAGGGIVLQATFQIPDSDGEPQNVRIGEFTDPFNSNQDDVVLVYGDDTGTHIREYGVTATGTVVTLLDSIDDPTTQTFDNLTVLGDGRIAITYNDLVNPSPDETSQYDFKIFDLRNYHNAGIAIDNSSLNDGLNKYIAGTQFQDTFTGENNVDNLYYYVGANVDINGPTPHDVFNGGALGTSGWNTAIFPDDAKNYTIIHPAAATSSRTSAILRIAAS